jgi:hypothetical protein
VPTIDTLRRDQLAEASSVLARAFDDDPVFRFLYPTPRRRRWTCRGFLRSIVRDALPFDEVWAAFDDDVVVGTAGWLPEGTYPPSSWRAARLLLSAWDSLLTPQTFRDGLRYLSETEKLHPKEPHWYLAVIGVEPARQGERRLVPPPRIRSAERGQPRANRPAGVDHVAGAESLINPQRPGPIPDERLAEMGDRLREILGVGRRTALCLSPVSWGSAGALWGWISRRRQARLKVGPDRACVNHPRGERQAAPEVPIRRAWLSSAGDVRCVRSVRSRRARIGRYALRGLIHACRGREVSRY